MTVTPENTLTRCKWQTGRHRALWTSATVPPNWKHTNAEAACIISCHQSISNRQGWDISLDLNKQTNCTLCSGQIAGYDKIYYSIKLEDKLRRPNVDKNAFNTLKACCDLDLWAPDSKPVISTVASFLTRRYASWGRLHRNFAEREFLHQKTRVPGLSYGTVCVILRLAVLVQ